MTKQELFKAQVKEGYTFKGEAIELGGTMFNGEVLTGSKVSIPLKTMNRHGLIAGATGSGKTKRCKFWQNNSRKLKMHSS